MKSSDVLYRFLRFGFYPRELPPVFRVTNYASLADEKRVVFDQFNQFKSALISIDGSTFQGRQRVFGIIHPLSYALLSIEIAESWQRIEATLAQSQASTAEIKMISERDKQGRAFFSAGFNSKDLAIEKISSGFPLLLSLDINRFYGSVYTHSIPWAALGKSDAQKMYASKKIDQHWSGRIDQRLRASNRNQTIGIPIGPDTSRVIAELILTRINLEIVEQSVVQDVNSFCHSIDDYRFGVMNADEAQKLSAGFEKIIREFHLRTREDKWALASTAECGHEWKTRLESLENLSQIAFIDSVFGEIYKALHSKFPENVLGYALTKYRKNFLKPEVRTRLTNHLQKTLFAFPWMIRWVAPIYIQAWDSPDFGEPQRRMVNFGISESCRKHDTLSVLWYLYLVLFFECELSDSLFDECFALDCPLIDLMLAHLIQNDLCKKSPKMLSARHQDRDLDSGSWIFSFETESRKWTAATTEKIEAKNNVAASFFKLCRKRNISFYDRTGVSSYLESGPAKGSSLHEVGYNAPQEGRDAVDHFGYIDVNSALALEGEDADNVFDDSENYYE